MAGRPSKSATVIRLEGRSHRTKKELALRDAGEACTLSGAALSEREDVAEDPVAHAEFVRVRELLAAIEKDDDLYSQAINDYCRLHSECFAIQGEISRIRADLDRLEEAREGLEDEFYFKVRGDLYAKQLKFDSALDKKRSAKRQIEDKNLMNIASALRSIPKTPETKTSVLREALSGAG